MEAARMEAEKAKEGLVSLTLHLPSFNQLY
jgi:hypothetical protein